MVWTWLTGCSLLNLNLEQGCHSSLWSCGSVGSIPTRQFWLCDSQASIQLIAPLLVPTKNQKSPQPDSFNFQLCQDHPPPPGSLPINSLWCRLACHFLFLQPWSLIGVILFPEKWVLCKQTRQPQVSYLSVYPPVPASYRTPNYVLLNKSISAIASSGCPTLFLPPNKGINYGLCWMDVSLKLISQRLFLRWKYHHIRDW